LQSADKETHSTLAESPGWAGFDRPLELPHCDLYLPDQHITEEEMQKQASKDKVTVLAGSKGRNRKNTPCCPNTIIIFNNFNIGGQKL